MATGARLVPRITIQAFCEHSQTAELVEVGDPRPPHEQGRADHAQRRHRRRGRDLQVEPDAQPHHRRDHACRTDEIPGALERLAEVCDATTRLIVLGHVNDVLLYRELIRSGVSEYIVLPTTRASRSSPPSPISSPAEGAAPIGRTVALRLRQGRRGRLDRRPQRRLGHQPAPPPGRADPRHGLCLRHRRPQLQPGPAARPRRRGDGQPEDGPDHARSPDEQGRQPHQPARPRR